MASNALPYEVGRTTGVCAATGERLAAGSACIATLCEREDETGLERRDYSLPAWESGVRPPGLFSYWRTKAPEPHDRRRLLVDDDVLLNLFERLADDERPQRVAFRFVLGLILMRKRVLKYVGRQEAGARELWLLRPRPAQAEAGLETPPIEVINPGLGDDDVRQISDQLGEILQAEL